MAKQLNVDMRFTADTSKAKQSINELQQAIQKLGYGSMPKNAGIDPALYKKAAENARELAYHLNAAYNTKTGNLDLSKLNASLKQSGTNLNQLTANFHNAGAAGQQAFTALARSIAAADQPTISINQHLSTMFTTLKNVARFQISSSIMHGLIGGIQTAYNYAQDLNESLNNIRIVTGQSVDQMARFADYANKTARQLSATTLDYTNASLIYYQQGLNDQQVKERTDVTIKMANVVRESAETVSQQLTAIWNNFDDGSKSLEYYADVITALGAATASSSSEISAGLNKFAAVADTVGLSYENATAALATITATTRQSADTVGTGLRTLFSRLQGLSLGDTLEDGVNLNKYSQALAKVGVQALDSSGNLRRMDEVLEDLGARWGDLTKAQQTALAQTVGGVRQYTTLVALMDNWDFMKQNQQIAAGAEGTLQNQADIYAESWEAAQKRVKAAIESIYQDLIKDDFFVKMNNSLEHLLIGVDAFIDKIGGVKTLIYSILSFVGMNIGDKIGPAIQQVIQNIQILTGGAKKVYTDMQDKFSTAVNAEIASGQYDMASKAELEGNNALLLAKTKMSMVNEQLSASERMQAELIISGLEVQAKKYNELAQAAQQAENEIKKANQDEEQAKANLISIYDDLIEKQQQMRRLNVDQRTSSTYNTAVNKTLLYQNNQKQYGFDAGKEEDWKKLQQIGVAADNAASEIRQKLIQALKDGESQVNIFSQSFANALGSTKKMDLTQAKAALFGLKEGFAGLENMVPGLGRHLQEAFNAPNIKTFKEQINLIIRSLYQAKVNTADYVQVLKSIGMADADIKKVDAAMKAVEGTTNEAKKKADIFAEALEQAKVAGEQLKATAEGIQFTHFVTGTQMITTLASSFGQLAMSINAFKSLFSTINDTDMTFAEKLTTSLMSISMIVPGLINLFKTYNMVMTFAQQQSLAYAISSAAIASASGEQAIQIARVNLATKLQANGLSEVVAKKAADILVTYNLTTAEGREIAIRELVAAGVKKETAVYLINMRTKSALGKVQEFLAIATNHLSAEQATQIPIVLANAAAWLHHPIFWIGAVLIAAITAMVIFSNKIKENAIAAEKAAKAAKELTQAAEEAKSAAENLKSTIDSYDSAVKKLEECKKGTEEWRDALKEVNSTAVDVLNTVGNNLSADDLTALRKSYYEEGQLDPKLLAKAQQVADQQALEAQYAASFAGYTASILNVNSQRANLARNIANSYNPNGEIIGGWNTREDYVKSLLEDYSEELSNLDLNGFRDRLEKLGIDLSNINNTTLQDWQAQIQSMGDQAARAAEKMALIAQVQVSEYLGDSATDAEKAYTATKLNAFAQEREDTWLSYLTSNKNKRRYEIYNENGQPITRYGGISQSSGVNNIVYQDALKALQAAGYNWNAATKNAVVGNDNNRFLAFTIDGQRKVFSAEEIAHMIAADEAFKYSVDENVEKYRGVRSNVGTSQGQEFLDQLVLGYNANTKSFNFADYITGLNKKDFDNLSGASPVFFKQLGLSIEDLQAFTSLYGIEFEDFLNGLQDQIKNTAEDWNILDNIPLISPDVLDSISLGAAQILYQNFKDIQLGPLGEQSGKEYIAGLNMILDEANPEDYNDIINDFLNIDFSAEGAPEQLKQILLDYGIEIQDDDIRLQGFVTRMQQAAGYFPEIVNLQEKISGGLSIIDKLKFGNAISDKDYEQLIQYTDGWEQFFSLQADGTHKFIGNQQELRKEFLKTIEVERKQFDNFQELQKETAESITPILSGGMKSSTSEISKMLNDVNFQSVLSANGYNDLNVVKRIIDDYKEAINSPDQDSELVKQAIARYQELWDRLVEFYGNDYEQARKELAQIEANSASTLLELNYGTYFDSEGNNITKFSDLTKEEQEAYTNRWNELTSTEMADAKTLGEAQQIFDRNSQLHLEGFEVPDLSKLTNYSDILVSVANNYKSCANEALAYQKAILSGSKEEIKAAEDSLKLAIAIEEVSAAANDSSVIVSDYGRFLQTVLAQGQGYTEAADKLSFLKELAADMNFDIDDTALTSLIPTLDILSTTVITTTGAFQQMEQRLSSISSTIKNLDFGSIISNEDYQKIKAFIDEMQRLEITAATGIDVDSLFLAQVDGSQKFIGDQKQLHELLKSNLDYEQEINNKTRELIKSLEQTSTQRVFSEYTFGSEANLKRLYDLYKDDFNDILKASNFKEEDIAKFFAGELQDETLFNSIKNTILNFWNANLDEIDQNLQERQMSLARNFTELNNIFNEEGGGNLEAYSQQWKVLANESLNSAKSLNEVTDAVARANAGAAEIDSSLNAADLEAYSTALLSVASGYESCKNEALALENATDETRQQATDTLAFAIAMEEVNAGMYQGTATANKYAAAVEDIIRSGDFTEENIKGILALYNLSDIEVSDQFIKQLEEMKDIVLKVDPVFANLRDTLKELSDITDDLKFGSLISEEEYQRLIKYNDALKELFQLQTNGQYKFIGQESDIANITQDQLNKTKERNEAQRNLASSFDYRGFGMESISNTLNNTLEKGQFDRTATAVTNLLNDNVLTDTDLNIIGKGYTTDELRSIIENINSTEQAVREQAINDLRQFASDFDTVANQDYNQNDYDLQDMQASLAKDFDSLAEMRKNLLTSDDAYLKQWQALTTEGFNSAGSLADINTTWSEATDAAISSGIDSSQFAMDASSLTDAYIRLGQTYSNCTDEVKAYTDALNGENDTAKLVAEQNLIASISAGELAKQYSLTAEDIEYQADKFEELYKNSKISRFELVEMAKEQLRYDRAVQKATKSMDDWKKAFTTGSIDSDMVNDLQDVYGDLLDINGEDLSASFIESQKNLSLLEDTMNGVEGAYEELRNAAMEELSIKYNVDTSEVQNAKNQLDAMSADLTEGVNIDIDADTTGAIAAFEDMVNAAGMSADQVQDLLSSMGYDAEVDTVTNTEQPETVAYSLTPKPDTVKVPYEALQGQPATATFPTIDYDVNPISAPDGKTTTTSAVKIKTLKKSSGGNVKYNNSSATGGGGSKKGGGGGGGKSSTKSKKEPVDTGDRYHAVREQLADLKEEYDNLAKAQDRAFGQQRIEIMTKMNENLRKTLETQDRYLQEIRSNLEKDTTALEDMATRVGVKINYDENGVITNYDDLRQAIRNEYNAAVDDYNAGKITDEGFEDVEKRFEESEKAVDLYEESLNLLSEESLKFLNIQNEIEDNSREIIEYKVEYTIELNDDELKYLDFLLQQLDNDAYDVAEALGLLGKEADENLDKIKTYSAGLDELLSRKLSPELMEKFYSGELSVDDLAGVADFTADDIEDIRSYEDAIMSADKALQDARKTVEDKFMSSMQQLEGEVDDVAERFENLTSVLDHYRNIIDIVGKDQLGITDDILKGLTDIQINIGVDQVEESLKKVQAFQNTYDNIVKILSKPDQLTESEKKYWKDRQKDVQKALDEAQEEYLSNFENAVQAIFDGYTQVLERAINKFLENSGLADSIGRLKDFISSVDDENVSNVTKTYELTKLTRDIQKSMDESPNVKNKRSLLELQNKINDAMRDGEKYSQAQLDILRKEYELKMARIALDEMEQAKSTVRMSRDNEGNWSYVYVADEDQMQAAEDELQTKIYEYNQLVEESYRELIDLSQQMTQDWSDQYKEIMTDTTLSDEERQRQLEILNEKYKEGLDDLNAKQTWMVEAANVLNEEEYKSRAEAINIITDGDAHLQQVFDDTAWAQAAALENMTATLTDFETNSELVIDAGAEAWKEYQANLEEVMEAAGTSVNTFANTVTDRTDEISTEAEEVKESVDQLTESLKNEMEAITEYISKWQQDYVEAIEYIINSNTKLVESCKDLIKMLTEANKISYEITNNNNSNGNTGGGANRASATANYNNSSSGSSGGGSSGRGGSSGSGGNGGGPSGGGNAESKTKYYLPSAATQAIINTYGDKNTPYGTFDKKTGAWIRLDTGGYTGDWNSSEGRLAVLHQKEQVFNAEDTEKLLDAAILLRTLDMSISNMAFGLGELMSGSVTDQTETIEQDVHITAEFPNVTNHSEIEEAFNNLIGKAAQFANRKR